MANNDLYGDVQCVKEAIKVHELKFAGRVAYASNGVLDIGTCNEVIGQGRLRKIYIDL